MRGNGSIMLKPEVVFIHDLLQELESRTLEIPRFQRNYCWRPRDILDLFDSIYKGYPIGSLLLWKPPSQVETKPGKPHKAFRQSASTQVLDGHQRLRTLWGCLIQSKILDPPEPQWIWQVWFDLERGEFVHLQREAPQEKHFPVTVLLRTVDFIREVQRRSPMSESWTDTAEHLAGAIRGYKIAVNRIIGGDLRQAVEIFARLNKAGVKVSPEDMVAALTYRGGGIHLAEWIEQVQEDLAFFHFDELGRSTLFQAVLAATGEKLYETNWEALAERLKKDHDLPGLLGAVKDALKRAVLFLRDEIGLPCDALLPYSKQLILLGEFFRICPDPGLAEKALLTRWFWVTSYAGWFAGASPSRIDRGIEEMRQVARGMATGFTVMSLKEPARPFPSRFDSRSARIRVWILFLASLRPMDPTDGTPIETVRLLRDVKSRALVHVEWYGKEKGKATSSPANRIILERKPGHGPKTLLQDASQPVLDSHGIPPDAHQALLASRMDDFITIRAQHLAHLERSFMEQRGVTLPIDSLDFEDVLPDAGDDEPQEFS